MKRSHLIVTFILSDIQGSYSVRGTLRAREAVVSLLQSSNLRFLDTVSSCGSNSIQLFQAFDGAGHDRISSLIGLGCG